MTKQRMTTRAPALQRNGDSVLDRLEDMDVRTDGIKMVLYGRSGTGKTRLACTFPTPLLLIGTEDGRKSVAGLKDAKFVRIYTSQDLTDLLLACIPGGRLEKYTTLVLDTAGGLQDLITKEVLNLDELPVQKNWGMADKATWGIIGAQVKERLHQLFDVSDRYAKNTVVIAHERNFKEDTDGPGSDLLLPAIGAALSPGPAMWLHAKADYVGQTFIRPEKVKKRVEVAGQKKEKEVNTGKAEYCLRVNTHPVYMTRFRVPVGTLLPDVIVEPHFSKIAALVRGEAEE
jgi:hypothetical protein